MLAPHRFSPACLLQAEKQQRVIARQQQRALQRRAAAAEQEREQLVYLPDSPIPMRVVLPPSSSVPNSGGFGASSSFLVRACACCHRASLFVSTDCLPSACALAAFIQPELYARNRSMQWPLQLRNRPLKPVGLPPSN